MDLLVLGVGGAFSEWHYSTSFLLRDGEHTLLVDCPHPIRKMINEAESSVRGRGVEIPPMDWHSLSALVLTHLHADHCSGTEGLAYYHRFVVGGRLPLAIHPRVGASLWREHLAAGMSTVAAGHPGEGQHTIDEFFDVHTLSTRRQVEVGGFLIETRHAVHSVPTSSLRITGVASGASIGFSADTQYDPGLVEWLGEADAFVHETGPGIHTPLAKLVGSAPELRAKMHLAHYPDDLDEAAARAADINVLRAGDLMRVEAGSVSVL